MLAGLVAVVLNFYELGAPHLAQDEAQYALVTDDVRRGNWLSPSPYPPTAYNQKPPLYFWLSALTYDYFEEPARYRVWSAAAGVAAVVMTAYLGTIWVGLIPGLAGALLLAGHGRWLFIHGARDGVMDTLLTLLHLVMLWVTVEVAYKSARPTRFWLGLGLIAVCAAAASMLKPGFGAVLGLSGLVLVVTGGGSAGRYRVMGAVLVTVVSGLSVALFWSAMGASGGQENVTRWISGFADDPLYYLRRLGASSPMHYLALPAMVVTLGFGRKLREPVLVVMGGVPLVWLVVLSLAGGKNLHYIFAVLPLICLSISWAMSEGLARLVGPGWRDRARRIGQVALLVYAVGAVGYHVAVSIPAQRLPYAPMAFAAIDAGEPVVLVGMGTDQIYWRNELGLSATDCYYLLRMLERGAVASDALPVDEPTIVVAALGSETAKLLGTPIDGSRRVGVYRVTPESR